MIVDLFMAPGRFICRSFSKGRKRSRYYSTVAEQGPAVLLSILSWVFVAALAVGLVLKFASPPIPRDYEPEPTSPPAAAGVLQTPAAPPASSASADNPPQAAEAAIGRAVQPTSTSIATSAAEPPAAEVVAAPLAAEVWLVIVESVPKSARTEAERSQARHKRRGVELDLADTDAYPLLKGGMWTLVKGPFDTKAEAEAAARELKPKVKDLMVRRGL
jgi:hypothetical protein